MLKGFVSGEEKDIVRIPMKGKNLFDKSTARSYAAINPNTGEVESSYSTRLASDWIDISDNDGYIYIGDSGVMGGAIYDNSKTFITGYSSYGVKGVPNNAKFLRVTISSVNLDTFQVNLGSQPLPYEPYGYQEGWEVRDNQDRLLWGREDELQTATGTLPFKGYTLPVKVKSLLGNAVQNGTPSPQNIVTPEMCGKLVGSDWTIPLTNAGQTIPVYLGEVPTVRRVRKLVLDGTENWSNVGGQAPFQYLPSNFGMLSQDVAFYACSHYKAIAYNDSWTSNDKFVSASAQGLRFKDSSFNQSLDDFKAYLTAQYQNGTPVTIWYVLATEQTTISNEPLCKISTYADELTTIGVHGLSAPLYGIGDYKDTLNLSTGVVTRKVKKLVLTGQETMTLSATSSAPFRINISSPIINSPTTVNILCTHYVGASASSSWSGYNYCVTSANNVSGEIRFRDVTYGTDIDGFKAYLASEYAAGHPVTIWYILSTPTTETVTVPTGMTGEIEGYLTQVSTPSPTNRSVPKWNGVEETGGTYAVTVYTPPEIPTTTGQNTLTVDSNLAPSKLEVSIHAKKIHYGFKIDKSNDNSESAVIYTHDAVTMTPAHMDFTNDRFDYGSWGNAFFVRDCYPVALNLDGTIAYRLDPDDYTKKTDGTASDIFYELLSTAPSDWNTQWKQYYTKSGDEYILNDQGSAPTFATDTYYKLTYNSSFTGNFMMAFPKVWFYRHEDSQYNYIEISNYKLSDDWKCYAHINTSGQEVDFIYLPLFKGVIVNSKLRSLPGQIPQGNTNATTEVNAATALGSRWQIWDHSSVELINDLLTLMSKSIDSQGRYGAGRSSAYNASDTVTYGKLQSGTLIKKGKFHGYSSGYKDVKVFGIEGIWANRYDRIQGLLLANGVWKVKMTPPYNFTGTDFVTLSSASVPTDAGYLSRIQTSEYGSIPAATISTSGKYFKDFFYRYSNDICVPLRGGNCGDTDIAGYRFIYAGDPASRTVWSFGASPVYK